VFSLTCLAYELCARRVPFDGLSDEAIEEAVAHRGERPSLVFQDDATLTSTSSSTHPHAPDEQVTNRLLCQLPTAVRELITQGWGQNPERRPSALEVLLLARLWEEVQRDLIRDIHVLMLIVIVNYFDSRTFISFWTCVDSSRVRSAPLSMIVLVVTRELTTS
jgi:hypothetical protein